MSSAAALPSPRISVEEADRPQPVVLRAAHLHRQRVLTHRCVGCGAKTQTTLVPAFFWCSGALFRAVRAMIFLFSLYLGLLVFGEGIRLLPRQAPSALFFLVLAAAALTTCLIARVGSRALTPHVKTAFAQCGPCRRRVRNGRWLLRLVTALGVLAPFAMAIVVVRTVGYLGDGTANLLLTASAGVLLVLWLKPLFRAGERRQVLAKKITKTEVRLMVPPTFALVLALERPDLLIRR